MTLPVQKRASPPLGTVGRCLSKKQAAHLGLPWAPPPDLSQIREDGYTAAMEFEMSAVKQTELGYFSPDENPDECPWPINTPEGHAWIAGWNEYCQENHIDEIRCTHP